MWRKFILTICGIFTLLILCINWKFYDTAKSSEALGDEISRQLRFLERQLKEEHLGEKMQQLYPEGLVFVNALYGLAWCEWALAQDNPEIGNKALLEVRFAYDQINSRQAQRFFPSELDPDYGVFYAGWRNYLLGSLLSLKVDFPERTILIQQFTSQCEEIASALKEADSPFLESYSHQKWPADMMVAITSLKIHDQLFAPRYEGLIKSWLVDIERYLDEETQLIPHQALDGEFLHFQEARGSSSALMLRLLSVIDSSTGRTYYNQMKPLFHSTTFGLPSVREYPVGTFGLGDVDSGPVIFGVGFAATIVMMGTMATYGDTDEAMRLYQTIHAFGFERSVGEEQQYLWGQLPMADAFIVWGKTAILANSRLLLSESVIKWTWRFHGYSFVLLSVIWLSVFASRIRSFLTEKS